MMANIDAVVKELVSTWPSTDVEIVHTPMPHIVRVSARGVSGAARIDLIDEGYLRILGPGRSEWEFDEADIEGAVAFLNHVAAGKLVMWRRRWFPWVKRLGISGRNAPGGGWELVKTYPAWR